MYEDAPGTSRYEGEKSLPPDAKVYIRLKAWVLYTSDRKGEFIIDTTDYHPGALHLKIGDLEKILAELPRKSRKTRK